MKSTNQNIDSEKIIALLFILALSSVSFFSLLLINPLNNLIKQILFYFGFFGYGFVIISTISFYVDKAKEWINKDKIRIIVTIASILAIAHAVFTGLDNQSWYSFFGYLAGDGLIIFIGTFMYQKWQNPKQNSNKLR